MQLFPTIWHWQWPIMVPNNYPYQIIKCAYSFCGYFFFFYFFFSFIVVMSRNSNKLIWSRDDYGYATWINCMASIWRSMDIYIIMKLKIFSFNNIQCFQHLKTKSFKFFLKFNSNDKLFFNLILQCLIIILLWISSH